MFSPTLRTRPEAKLPKAARHSCGDSLGHLAGQVAGHVAGQLPMRGWYRGLAALAAASSHVVPGTNDRSTLDCFASGIEIELQNPGGLS
jgi:hypothetical protein